MGGPKGILIVVFTFLSTWLMSQSIVTDRPDQTEASVTVPKRSFQIETGLLVQTVGKASDHHLNVTFPTTLLRYGLLNVLELRLLSEFSMQRMEQNGDVTRRNGINDIQIGAKVQLFRKTESKHEVAFMSHLIVPSGTGSVTGRHLGNLSKLCISHGFNDVVSLGYNVGYAYWGTGVGDLTYSVSLALRATDKLGFYVEPYGNWVNFEGVATNLNGGFTYLIKSNLQFDFSIGAGLDNRMSFISTGISWNIGKS